MGNRIKVSICTPHYNKGEELLRPFLDSMLGSTDDSVEIVVVDNGSSDNSRKILEEYGEKWGERVKGIFAEENLGFGRGSNLAAHNASGEYILFLNNDVIAQAQGWIDSLINISRTKKDKALVGAELVKNNMHTAVLDYGPVTYLNGWCIFGHRSIFEKIGFFDPLFKIGFFEDVELCVRAQNAGYELMPISLPLVHLGSQTIKKFFNTDDLTKKGQPYFRSRIIQHRLNKNNTKRYVFMAPGGDPDYKFTDYDWEGKGVGGAEAAFINLTRALARKGHEVWVYNNCEKQGIFNGVHWAHIDTFKASDYCDSFVLFRHPHKQLKYVNSPIKIFWSCDQYTIGSWTKAVFPYIDKVVAISPYHKWYLTKYKEIDEEFVDVIDLGISKEDYDKPVEKIPGRLIFCSVPHRGLGLMKDLFADIKKKVPDATLTITSDYRLWGGTADNEQYRHLRDIPGVTFLGKIPRSELVQAQLEAEVMAYPCTYEELFCISAAECIAAGAIPVTTPLGALPTTVGDSGIILRKESGEFKEAFVEAVVELLTNKDLADSIRQKGRERMLNYYSWDYLANQWTNYFNDIMSNKMEGGEKRWQPKKEK